MNPNRQGAWGLHLMALVAMLLLIPGPAQAQRIGPEDAIRVARGEVANRVGVSPSDVRIGSVTDDGRGNYTVQWSTRHPRQAAGSCVVSRHGRVIDFQQSSLPPGPDPGWRPDPQQATRAVQDELRRQVEAREGGSVIFGLDASTYDASRGKCGVRGSAAMSRHGRTRTLSYSGVYDGRTGGVEQLTYNFTGQDPNPPGPASGNRVTLRGPNGQYVSMDWSSSNAVCRGGHGGGGATLSLVVRNGHALQNGDQVSLRFERGGWLSAENGGGRGLLSNGRSSGPWETFTIVKLDTAAGPFIRSGDRVAFRAPNGQFITAEDGGGGKLNCKGGSQGPWEIFIIEFR